MASSRGPIPPMSDSIQSGEYGQAKSYNRPIGGFAPNNQQPGGDQGSPGQFMPYRSNDQVRNNLSQNPTDVRGIEAQLLNCYSQRNNNG